MNRQVGSPQELDHIEDPTGGVIVKICLVRMGISLKNGAEAGTDVLRDANGGAICSYEGGSILGVGGRVSTDAQMNAEWHTKNEGVHRGLLSDKSRNARRPIGGARRGLRSGAERTPARCSDR